MSLVNESYDFELERIKDLIKVKGAKRVGVQLPAGLKPLAIELAAQISKETGAEVIVSGSSCYGACDVDEKLEGIVDLLFHFGHTETSSFTKRESGQERAQKRVFFIELRSTVNITPVVEKALTKIKGDSVGLVATVQHVHALNKAKRELTRAAKGVVIGKSYTLPYPGQVLGCDFSSALVAPEEILFIGSGSFHPVGIALYTGKRVIAADPFTQHIALYEPEELRKRRWIEIGRALDAHSFGILIGLKRGQCNLSEAIVLKRKAVEKGFAAYLISMEEINEENLLGFDVDAFVNTACPRLVEDFVHFKKPVVSVREFTVVLGERDWGTVF
jgi:2-(3-amino-3-carboxypropyl)histidine synthase